MRAQLFLVALLLPCRVLSRPAPQLDQGLGGLFGGGETGDDDPMPLSPEIYPKIHKQAHSTSKDLGVSSSTTETSYNARTSSTTQATISTSTTSHSSLGPEETTSPTIETSTPTATIGVTKQAASTPPAEMEEWKVIGMVTLGIAFVGIVMFTIAFFDSWWGFLRALVGKKKEDATEDLFPNWMDRELKSEEGHRYPSLKSLAQPTVPIPVSPDPRHCLVPSLPPATAYPLEPLFRRPSGVGQSTTYS